MIYVLRRLWAWALVVCCTVLVPAPRAIASLSTPKQLITRGSNVIVWQRQDYWLVVTEDLSQGRTCYYLDHDNFTRMYLKKNAPGNWAPLGSAIKWLMYTDYYQGLNRLMAGDVDWNTYHIARLSQQNQIGCGMVGTQCIYAQYRAAMSGDHYPVDLYYFHVDTGLVEPFCVSNSEKTDFAHDGNLIVYRSHIGPGDDRIYGHFFSGGDEFEIAARNGLHPTVCGSLVAWAEVSGSGYNIWAKNIATGEMRLVAFTSANPPRPEAGHGAIFWEDARNQSKTGLDIYGYDWDSGREFPVTTAAGDQVRLKASDDLITWVSGLPGYEILWGSDYTPPARITDLRITSVAAADVFLAWTSPGTGVYEIRMRTDAPIADSNWDSSSLIQGNLTAKQSGQAEAFDARSLGSGYCYFALKVKYTDGTESPVSNCVCAFIGDESSAIRANQGTYISFTGVVTGLGSGNAVYCRKSGGVGAVRVIIPQGTAQIGAGKSVTVTGQVSHDDDLLGPVLQAASVTQLSTADLVRCIAMPNKAVGGFDPQFGGTIEHGASNQWMLVKTWGRVSGLVSSNGCSFYINDQSIKSGQRVYVVSQYAPPNGLTNGSFVTVQGIARVSKTLGREIEIVNDGAIQMLQ